MEDPSIFTWIECIFSAQLSHSLSSGYLHELLCWLQVSLFQARLVLQASQVKGEKKVTRDFQASHYRDQVEEMEPRGLPGLPAPLGSQATQVSAMNFQSDARSPGQSWMGTVTVARSSAV